MSGIVGILYRDGRQVDSTELQRMVDILAHRGPDGVDVWHEEPVGLGHCMLHTTPESLNEKMPFVNQTTGLAITADARIDNREELLHLLRLDDRPAGDIPDSQIILAAYERWGEHCPEHLLGDFAFAIWDRNRQQLFCARDHFGVRPFFYHLSDEIFAFGSEIKALLALNFVPHTVDEIQIGDFLTGLFEDSERTFYQAVRRLSPGHILLADNVSFKLRPYWSLDMPEIMNLGRNQNYVAAFRELFDEAVRCRLRSHAPIGLLLSGGLDSSSLAVIAETILTNCGHASLHTFSGIFEKVPECDERKYIQATLNEKNIQSRLIRADTVGPLTDINRLLWFQDEPFDAPHLFMRWHLSQFVSLDGCRVVLDGYDGDTTISHGFGLLSELARAGKWVDLATNLRGLTSVDGRNYVSVFLAYLWKLNFRSRLLRFRLSRKLRRVWRSRLNPTTAHEDAKGVLPPWAAPVAEEFARTTALFDRYHAWEQKRPERATTERERHYRRVVDKRHAAGLEALNRTGAAFGLEARHPFWDRRLLEFCLALPAEQKLNKGWGRLILRRAVEDKLPTEVCWRRDKTNFLPSFNHGLFSLQGNELKMIFNGLIQPLQSFVNLRSLNQLYERIRTDPAHATGYEIFALWRAVSLALWFDNRPKIQDLKIQRR